MADASTNERVSELVHDFNAIREQRRQVLDIIDRMLEREREILLLIVDTPALTVDEAEMKLSLPSRRKEDQHRLRVSATRDLRRLASQ